MLAAGVSTKLPVPGPRGKGGAVFRRQGCHRRAIPFANFRPTGAFPTHEENAMKWFVILSLVLAVAMTVSGSVRAANPVVVLETSMGNIKVELFEDKAPGTVKNFLSYVDDKHYDNTIFHRVIDGFMIQGGGMEAGMKEKKTKAAIKNESANGVSNTRGTLAMARTNQPDSATAQFFINVKDNDFLDKAKSRDGVGYCVFGKVIEGMDVVDKIKAVATTSKGGHENVPERDVLIKSAKRADANPKP
jgi:cyclophilin family peptidyl-prolyl cis-trans isomerase